MQRHQKKRSTTAASKNYKYASLIGIVLNAVEASLVLEKKASVEIALNSDIEVLTASHSLDQNWPFLKWLWTNLAFYERLFYSLFT